MGDRQRDTVTMLNRIVITVCQRCLDGEGDECHTPGCALWMHRVDIPIDRKAYRVLAREEAP